MCKVVDAAIHSGCIAELQKIVDDEGILLSVDVAESAAYYGLMETLKYLLEERGVPVTTKMATQAARSNHLETLKYLMEECGVQADEETVCKSVTESIDILRYLLGVQNVPVSMHTVALHVITARRLDCLQYLVEERGMNTISDMARWAIVIKQTNILRYLCEGHHPLPAFQKADTMRYANEDHMFVSDAWCLAGLSCGKQSLPWCALCQDHATHFVAELRSLGLYDDVARLVVSFV